MNISITYYPKEGKFSDAWAGELLERLFKMPLKRKYPDRLSPCGQSDFIFGGKHYDTKQNGSPIRYGESGYIKGSSRVIYATHLDITITDNADGSRTYTLHPFTCEFFVLDRNEFVAYLLDNNMAKDNPSRNQVNIQTLFNYTKNAYHGAKGKRLEEWARVHQLDDDIVTLVYDLIEE